MIPDWKLEKYLTGDLPENEMREIRETEATDEVFAGRVRMLRKDNLAILRKLPFETLSAKMDARSHNASGFSVTGVDKKIVTFKFAKFAAAAVLVFAVLSVSFLFTKNPVPPTAGAAGPIPVQLAMVDAENTTRIKGLDSRMEVWKKTEKGIVQMENLSDATEGDEIQLRYSVPQKCFGLLFSMDGNGSITMHMGNGNKAIALEPGKMVTLPYAYKLDNAPKFEKFFLLTSQAEFELDVSNVDAVLKKDGIEVKTLALRKVEGGR